MANRAFLCGINDRPDAPLAGCLNDISDMANFLHTKGGFDKADIRLLADKRATTDEIMGRLTWLVYGVEPGDRLFFMFSGYGAVLAERARTPLDGDVDQVKEVLCPSDFDWNKIRHRESHSIYPQYLETVFGRIPDGVQCTIVLDTCHAGSAVFDTQPASASSKRGKSLRAPLDLEWREQVAKEKALTLTRFDTNKAAIITACQPDQVGIESRFNGHANGVLTYWLLRALNSPGGLSLPLPTILKMVQGEIKKTGGNQTPELRGSQSLCQGSFLGSK